MNTMKWVNVNEDWTLRYALENGEERVFDMKPYLSYEAFEPLREMTEFRKFHNGKYFVEWECGADLSLDTLDAGSRVVRKDLSHVS